MNPARWKGQLLKTSMKSLMDIAKYDDDKILRDPNFN